MAHATRKSKPTGPQAPRQAFPRPYAVALADGDAHFAPAERTPRCIWPVHEPALHRCGCTSVATATVPGGFRRVCAQHAANAVRFGVPVTYDVGYVVAE